MHPPPPPPPCPGGAAFLPQIAELVHARRKQLAAVTADKALVIQMIRVADLMMSEVGRRHDMHDPLHAMT